MKNRRRQVGEYSVGDVVEVTRRKDRDTYKIIGFPSRRTANIESLTGNGTKKVELLGIRKAVEAHSEKS